jgi:hypothetical protein
VGGADVSLDPWHITISHHARTRYAERRGWGRWKPTADVDDAIRQVLARCAHLNPPLRVRDGRAGRTYRHGDLVFIVSADQLCVITCYAQSSTPQGKRRRQKKVHAAARERARA